MEAVRGCIEHQIPKARGQLFVDLISAFADSVCLEKEPLCRTCPLLANCPTGQERKEKAPVASSRKARSSTGS
jgi:endonuclease-3